jgi:hypothetical protein
MMTCSSRCVGLVALGLALIAGPAGGALIHQRTFDADATDAVGGLKGTVQGPVTAPGTVGNGLLFEGQNDSVECTGCSRGMRNELHLSTGPDTARRVAKNRHVRLVNRAYTDGDSGKVKREEMTPYHWGAPGPKVR